MRFSSAPEEHALSLTVAGLETRDRGDYATAEWLLRTAVEFAERELGPTHFELGRALNGLGIVLKYTGNFSDAEVAYARALEVFEAADADDSALASVQHNIGGLAHARGNHAAAEAPSRRAVELRERALGPGAREVAADRAALAAILDELGRGAEAEALLREALRVFERELGPDDHEVAVTLANLGAILQRRGELGAAEDLHRRALAIKERTLGADHPELATTLSNLATTLVAAGRAVDAVPLLRRGLALAEGALEPDHANLKALRANLAKAEAAAGPD